MKTLESSITLTQVATAKRPAQAPSWWALFRAALVRIYNHAANPVVVRVWNGGGVERESGKNASPRLYINGKLITIGKSQRPKGGDSWNSTT
ncbi:MAG: hypothetical protein E1N59_852 [Puniceicoccaceae bacterium 5H]|nr:MAG: hypothetical protein E1N59_852 [Puniceicoccaceae bacterium 5H]